MLEGSTVEESRRPVEGQRPLTISDRCDRCGAQAYVRVVVGGSDLLFCGHHYGRFGQGLRSVADRIDDHTEMLDSSN